MQANKSKTRLSRGTDINTLVNLPLGMSSAIDDTNSGRCTLNTHTSVASPKDTTSVSSQLRTTPDAMANSEPKIRLTANTTAYTIKSLQKGTRHASDSAVTRDKICRNKDYTYAPPADVEEVFGASDVDKVYYGHEDDGRQDCFRNVLQCGRDDVQCEEHNNSRSETGDGRASATVRVDCRARKRSCTA